MLAADFHTIFIFRQFHLVKGKLEPELDGEDEGGMYGFARFVVYSL